MQDNNYSDVYISTIGVDFVRIFRIPLFRVEQVGLFNMFQFYAEISYYKAEWPDNQAANMGHSWTRTI